MNDPAPAPDGRDARCPAPAAGDFTAGTLRGLLDRGAALHPGKPWLVCADDERSISYGELAACARRIASHLARLGVGRNDRIVLLSGNSLEHLVVYTGVLAAGATICTINVEMNRGHFDVILPRLEPRLVIHEEALGLEPLSAAMSVPWRPLGRWLAAGGSGFFADLPLPASSWPQGAAGLPADDAVIFFTSGTSARPKGVVLTYLELLGNAAAASVAFGMGPDERIYDYRSFNWASAQLLSALGTLVQGSTLLLGRRFSRSRFFADIARLGATVAAGNPTVVSMLLQGPDTAHARDIPSLRFMTSSSAPLPVEDWRRFEERFGIMIAQGYGTSETGWIAACFEANRRMGSVGRPLPHHRIAIVGRDGAPLPAGELGFVEIGGFADTAYRYIGDDGVIRVSSVGRARTGDMGYLDADGYLYLTGRETDLIIRGGVNISPAEIENLLLQCPGVAAAAAVGIPDRVYGEEVVCYIVPQPGSPLQEEHVRDFCSSRMPAFKAPKRILLCDALPRNERGKLDRKALVAQWLHAN